MLNIQKKGKNSYNRLQQGSLQFYLEHLVQVLNEQILIALVASVYYHLFTELKYDHNKFDNAKYMAHISLTSKGQNQC